MHRVVRLGRLRAVASCCLALAAPGCTAVPEPGPSGQAREGWPAPPADATRARVVRVVDGDTVVLSGISVGRATTGGRSARLIGVDTPEVRGSVECYGSEASAFTRRILAGREVRVGFDVDRTDRFGRALVYLWTEDGTLFNASLVAEGYAQQLTVPPNVRYAELFSALVRTAREAERGLWDASACP